MSPIKCIKNIIVKFDSGEGGGLLEQTLNRVRLQIIKMSSAVYTHARDYR